MSDAVVRAAPDLLQAFARRSREEDLALAGVLDDARDAVERYLARCDPTYTVDPRTGLEDVRALVAQRQETALAVGHLGRAFAALDDGPATDDTRAGAPHAVTRAALAGGPVPAGTGGMSVMRARVVVSTQSRLDDRVVATLEPPPDLHRLLVPHDPARWLRLVTGLEAAACPATIGAWHEGRGFLLGPDGETYPLAVPTVEGPGGPRDAAGVGLSWERLEGVGGGTSLGWVDVATWAGTTRLQPDPGIGHNLAGFVTGMNPNSQFASGPAPRGVLDAVGFGAHGVAGGVPPAPPGPPAPPLTPPDPRSPERRRAGTWIPQPPGVRAGPSTLLLEDPGAPARPPRGGRERDRTSRPLSAGRLAERLRPLRGRGVGDAVGALPEAIRQGARVRDQGLAHVEVRFQRTSGGRRRALARVITARRHQGVTVLQPAHLTVDERGRPVHEPMRGDPHPTLAPADDVGRREVLVTWGR